MGIKTTRVVLVISHGKNQIDDSGDWLIETLCCRGPLWVRPMISNHRSITLSHYQCCAKFYGLWKPRKGENPKGKRSIEWGYEPSWVFSLDQSTRAVEPILSAIFPMLSFRLLCGPTYWFKDAWNFVKWHEGRGCPKGSLTFSSVASTEVCKDI